MPVSSAEIRRLYAQMPDIAAVARALSCTIHRVRAAVAHCNTADPPFNPLVASHWSATRDIDLVAEFFGYSRDYVVKVLRKSLIARRMRAQIAQGRSTHEIAEELLCPVENVRAIALARPASVDRRVPPPQRYVKRSTYDQRCR